MTVDEVIDTSLESCVDMCRTLEATCTTPALPAGEYTVVWGGVRLPIEIPSETAAVRYPEYCCDDDDDCRPGATCDLDTHRCPSLGP